MADPLGCVAVTETGLKLALAVGKLIQALHDAPDELLALSNELCDLRLTVERVRQATSNTAHPSELPGIGPLLFQARIRFEEAERILTRLGQLGPYGTVWNLNTWERILWQKEKKKVVVLQKQLRAIRSNVSLILGTHSSYARLDARLGDALCNALQPQYK